MNKASRKRKREAIQGLARALTCPLCHDLFEQPHSLRCGHRFCFYCIEEALKEKCECPQCHQPMWNEKRPCPLVANLCEKYKRLKQSAAEMLGDLSDDDEEEESGEKEKREGQETEEEGEGEGEDNKEEKEDEERGMRGLGSGDGQVGGCEAAGETEDNEGREEMKVEEDVENKENKRVGRDNAKSNSPSSCDSLPSLMSTPSSTDGNNQKKKEEEYSKKEYHEVAGNELEFDDQDEGMESPPRETQLTQDILAEARVSQSQMSSVARHLVSWCTLLFFFPSTISLLQP